MKKSSDILGSYGPETRKDSRATCGGVCEAREIPNYKPPVGPKGQSHNTVGLGGTNHGCVGTQGRH